MLTKKIVFDIATQTAKEVEVEEASVVSLEEGIHLEAIKAVERHNAAIRAQLDANDLKAIRAILDGDAKRMGEFRQAQEALRALLK